MNVMFFNLIGLGLLIFAIIMHIVCIATVNFGYLDFSEVRDNLEKTSMGKQALKQFTDSMNPNMMIHFGVWKLCAEGLPEGGDRCVKLGFTNDYEGKELDAPDWIKATQAMSIIGLLVAAIAAGVSILHFVKQSRGDRLRFMPLILLGLCSFAALFLAIGIIVYGAKFSSMFSSIYTDSISYEPNRLFLSEEMNAIEEALHFDWGFALDAVATVLVLIAGAIHLGTRIMDNGVV